MNKDAQLSVIHPQRSVVMIILTSGMRRTILAASVIGANIASAQTVFFGIDGGQRMDKHLNGVANKSYVGGLSLSAVLGGDAGKDFALVFPIAGEFRFSNGGYSDMNAFLDAAIRVKAVTLGAGGAFSWDDAPDIKDLTAGGSSGSVPILLPMSWGYSGFGKLNVGPQGRLFFQGRYTLFPASLSYHYKFAEVEQTKADNGLEDQDVPARNNVALRAAVGYVLPNRSIIRAQYVAEAWRYERIFDNRTGAYDRDTNVGSLGFWWYF